MIDRATSIVQFLITNHNQRDRMWVAAMARQTLTQISSSQLRAHAELGYDANFGNGYNSRFYSLSNAARRPSMSLTWALDGTRWMQTNGPQTPLDWKIFVNHSSSYLNCLFCSRNTSSSSISWVEDPSDNIYDYIAIAAAGNNAQGQYAGEYVIPRVMDVLHVFGSICFTQSLMYGPEARNIPDMSRLVRAALAMANDLDKTIINNFLRISAPIRLICRSYVAEMENANADGSTAGDAVRDADVPVAEGTDTCAPVSIALAAAPEGVVMRSPRGDSAATSEGGQPF